MDVVTPEHARIAEDAGAVAVMALERVPADIRAHGGVARMSDPELILQIMESVSIPVMAKCRIGHFVEAQILESLDSKSPDIHYQAVCAAGNWEIDAAWSHIARLVTSENTDKPLLLAAIEAAACIHPQKSSDILLDLTESEDEDIVEAAHEAMVIAGALSEEEEYDDEDEFFH